jgi:hypothetical protein
VNAIFTCPKCHWTGDAPHERIERLAEDDMHDRPLIHVDVEVHCCPKCDNDELAHACACEVCHKRAAIAGADECQECLDAIARHEAQLIAEFASADDAFDFYRMRGMRGYSITAGVNMLYAVRRIA